MKPAEPKVPDSITRIPVAADTVILSDAPEVVEAKRRFRELDEREELLKRELEAVRADKQRIARMIFAHES